MTSETEETVDLATKRLEQRAREIDGNGKMSEGYRRRFAADIRLVLAALSRAPEAGRDDAAFQAIMPFAEIGAASEIARFNAMHLPDDHSITAYIGIDRVRAAMSAARAALSHPSPEMGEISTDDLWDALKRQCCATKPNSEHWDEVSTIVTVRRSDVEAAVYKLKENGLSREGLGGLARSLPSGDAQERSPVPPISDGWRDISSAPRDDQAVLIWNAEGAEIARWHPREEDGSDQPGHDEGWIGTFAFPGRSWGHRLRYEPQGQPTHWMPLPSPPQNSDGEDA